VSPAKARFLLDSDTCIYALSQRHPELSRRLNRLKPGEAALAAAAYGELRFGAEKSQRRDDALLRLAALTRVAPVLPLTDAAGARYGVIRAELERAGTPIGGNDLWIAAQALAEKLVLVSHNRREFARVRGLKLQDWME